MVAALRLTDAALCRYQPYLRYTAPQMAVTAFRLTGTALIFNIPPLRWYLLSSAVKCRLQLIHAALQLIGDALQLAVTTPDLRYTAPQLISNSSQLEGAAIR